MIELMIVVAIIAILAAIAVPAYQDYVIRAQVSEGAILSDPARNAMMEFYQNNNTFPSTNASAGLPQPASISGKYVSQVDLGSNPGVIKATFSSSGAHVANALLNGKVLAFSAVTQVGSLVWHCANTTYTTVPARYLPSSCRGVGR